VENSHFVERELAADAMPRETAKSRQGSGTPTTWRRKRLIVLEHACAVGQRFAERSNAAFAPRGARFVDLTVIYSSGYEVDSQPRPQRGHLDET